jgi:glycosyltransferase involved in cell wall biosynthesis
MTQRPAQFGLVTGSARKNVASYLGARSKLQEHGITFRFLWIDQQKIDFSRPGSVLRYIYRYAIPHRNRGLIFWTIFSRRLDFLMIKPASSAYYMPWTFRIAALIAGFRGAAIYFVHGNCSYILDDMVKHESKTRYGRIRISLARRFFQKSNYKHVAHSPQCCEDVAEHFGIENVALLNHAPKIPGGEFRDELPTDPPLYINVGNFSHRKGADLFLEVARKCLEQNPKLRFGWVGKNFPAVDEIDWIRESGFQENFIFLKTKSPPFHHIRQSSGLIYTSRSEAFGLAVSEAMAMKRTVFCFERTGAAYQAKGSGYVFERFDTEAMANAVLRHAQWTSEERVNEAAFATYTSEFSANAFALRFERFLAEAD